MTTVQQYQNNVVTFRTSTDIARERARVETIAAERALKDNAEKFHTMMKFAMRTAVSSGSHIFAQYNEALAAAEQAVEHAKERLSISTSLFVKQLNALDQAKSGHDAFVNTVMARTQADTGHQYDLQHAKRIENKILAIKKQRRLQHDRYKIRSEIMKIENPFVWALYQSKIDSGEVSNGGALRKVLGNALAWFKGTATYKRNTKAIDMINAQINSSNELLSTLNAELNQVHESVFRVRDENFEKISKSHQSVVNAQSGFSAAETLKNTVTLELAVSKQTLLSLQTFDHPIAEHALQQFTDIVMTASKSNGNEDAVVFLMGSKRLADELISKIRVSDEEELDLVADLHYCKEAESMMKPVLKDNVDFAAASFR